jgi:hypothetical protein
VYIFFFCCLSLSSYPTSFPSYPWKFCPMFYSKSFIILDLTFTYRSWSFFLPVDRIQGFTHASQTLPLNYISHVLIHFELNVVYSVRSSSTFVHLHVDIQFSQHHLFFHV